MGRRLRALWRLLGLLRLVLSGYATLRLRFAALTNAEREARVQDWAQRVLRTLGIGLVVRGQPADGPVLLTANHISWLDIVVIHAARHCRFIAKSELQSWPLVATLAVGAGTLFIERASRRDALRVVHHMAERLQAGDVLAVFPEGTTGDGIDVLPFHANLLQAAIAVDAPVQPLALRFVDGASGQTSLQPCYIGDDTLLQSLWRTACSEGLQAQLHFGAVQAVAGRDRRRLAADLREAIVALRG